MRHLTLLVLGILSVGCAQNSAGPPIARTKGAPLKQESDTSFVDIALISSEFADKADKALADAGIWGEAYEHLGTVSYRVERRDAKRGLEVLRSNAKANGYRFLGSGK